MSGAEDAFQRLIDFEMEARQRGGWCFVRSLLDAREYIVGEGLPNVSEVIQVLGRIRQETGLEIDQPLMVHSAFPIPSVMCFIRKTDNEGHVIFIGNRERGVREIRNLTAQGYRLNTVLQYVRK